MTRSKVQTRAASLRQALAGVALAAVALSACGKGPDKAGAPSPTDASGTALTTARTLGTLPSAAGGLVVPTPTDVKAAPPGAAVPQNPTAAAEAVADNAKEADLAKQFEADPASIARQAAACGPANQVVNNLYALSHGAQTDELRRFRNACIAKDDAQRELSRKAASDSRGVTNTNSL